MFESLYRKTVLPNGIRVVTETMPNVRSVTTGIWVDVGSRDEEAHESGISHLLEHMFFKGTTSRDAHDIAKELDSIGGMSNAFTCREQTCFHAKVLDNHLDKVVDLLIDIFRNSLFAPDDLEREKQVVLQEISMVEETPEEYAHLLFNKEFWGDNGLGRSVLGETEIVSRFNHETVMEYIANCYVPSKIVFAAAGNVDHDTFVRLLGERMSDIEPGPGRSLRNPVEANKIVKPFSRSLEQVHLCLGAPGPSSTDQERYADIILTTMLGGNMSSRLFQEIREKRGLAYSVYSYVSSFTDTGMHAIYLAVRPDAVNESLKVCFETIEQIRMGRIDSHELEAAKEYLKGSVLLNMESSDNRMNRLARNELNFGRFIQFDEVIREIEVVSLDRIIDLAGRRFDPSLISLVSYGPWEPDASVSAPWI